MFLKLIKLLILIFFSNLTAFPFPRLVNTLSRDKTALGRFVYSIAAFRRMN